MENYKNISVNSEIGDVEGIKHGLYCYLHDRVWGDIHLLGGFNESQICDIIVDTIDKFGEDINHFVAVALEKVANEKPTKKEEDI